MFVRCEDMSNAVHFPTTHPFHFDVGSEVNGRMHVKKIGHGCALRREVCVCLCMARRHDDTWGGSSPNWQELACKNRCVRHCPVVSDCT